MAFLETPRLVDCIGFGVTGGPGFSTDVITTRAGYESRNANFVQARHRYEIGLTVRTKTEFESIQEYFYAVGGRRDGFRFKDWADFQVTTANGVLKGLHGTTQVGTAGVGYGTPMSQLQKKYTAGVNSYYRDIRKPVLGTLIARRAGVAMTAGVGAGQYAIDTTTGLITVVEDQSRAISSHTIGPNHVFTLASAFSPNLLTNGRIYVTGITGTAATLLNNLSHSVAGAAGAIVTTLTATGGLTASGGTAFFYPQPSETFDFSCEFDVPVRFDVDQFDAVIVNKSGSELLLELPSIPLLEIRV